MEYKREDLPLSAGAYLDVKRIIHKIVVLGVSIMEDCRKHFFFIRSTHIKACYDQDKRNFMDWICCVKVCARVKTHRKTHCKHLLHRVRGGPQKFLDVQNLVTSRQTLKLNTECNILILMTQKHSVSICQLFVEAKCLVRVIFPTVQECFRGEIFVRWRITLIVRRSLSSNTFKVCRTALGTVFHRDLQFTSGTRNFSFGRTTFEDSDRCGQLVNCASEETWPRCDVSDQRRPTRYRKWGKGQFYYFTGKLE